MEWNTTYDGNIDAEELKAPESQLEKAGCADAKKEAIEAAIEAKKKEYARVMDRFLEVEAKARDYRKQADKLKDVLGVSDKDLKELF